MLEMSLIGKVQWDLDMREFSSAGENTRNQM